jgi:hypothetical protein
VRGAWCVVRGAWCVVRGAWCVVRVRKAWCVVVWCVVRGAWCVVRGAWCVVRGAWCVIDVGCVCWSYVRRELRSVRGVDFGCVYFPARRSVFVTRVDHLVRIALWIIYKNYVTCAVCESVVCATVCRYVVWYN